MAGLGPTRRPIGSVVRPAGPRVGHDGPRSRRGYVDSRPWWARLSFSTSDSDVPTGPTEGGPTDMTLRCWHCEDVIGVYEPMIVLEDGRPRSTSRAAERDGASLVRECYHPACYAHV